MNINQINMPFSVTITPDKSRNAYLQYGLATATPLEGIKGVTHQFSYAISGNNIHLSSVCSHQKIASCDFAENEVLERLGAPRKAIR